MYYGEACNEFAELISTLLSVGKAAPFEEMSQQQRAVGNTVFDFTFPRFELLAFRSRKQRVIVQTTAWLLN